MTIYYPEATRPVTLKRESVERYRDQLVADAASIERRGGPSREERDMGMTAADLREQARAYRADAVRLTAVLACIDAGTPELPAQLYPS